MFTAPIAVKRIPKIAIGGNIDPAIMVQKIPKQTTKIPMSIAERGEAGSVFFLFLCMENASFFILFVRVSYSPVFDWTGLQSLPSGLLGCPSSVCFADTYTLAVPKIFCGIRLEYFDRGAKSCSLHRPQDALRKLCSKGRLSLREYFEETDSSLRSE